MQCARSSFFRRRSAATPDASFGWFCLSQLWRHKSLIKKYLFYSLHAIMAHSFQSIFFPKDTVAGDLERGKMNCASRNCYTWSDGASLLLSCWKEGWGIQYSLMQYSNNTPYSLNLNQYILSGLDPGTARHLALQASPWKWCEWAFSRTRSTRTLAFLCLTGSTREESSSTVSGTPPVLLSCSS